MLSRIGFCSARARASASSPQGYQSTGLCACWRRYGLVWWTSRFVVIPLRRVAGSRLRLHDVEQLHFKDQCSAGRDGRGLSAVAVGDRRRAHDLRLLVLLHLGDALGPARDHALQRELGGLAALHRAVEDGAVDELALVVDLDGVV